MKIKEGLISHKVGKTYVTVASGEAGNVFNGMLRSNGITCDILNLLEKEISEEELVDALYKQYDAPREEIAEDVHGVIEQIRAIGLLDE